ncbi:FKBP-type peptidyl-prolyl cis-trans isomerase [Niabella terrae]
MKSLHTLGLSLLFAGSLAAQTKKPAAPVSQPPANQVALRTLYDSASYAIGQNIASSISKDLKDLNKDAFLEAIRTVFNGQTARFQTEELHSILSAFSQQQEEQESKSTIDAGQAFLEKNKTQPGVITTPSGLQYKILKDGSGVRPTATDTVVCHYIGRLSDSTEFDNSYERGTPLNIVVANVIPGWTEGLQLMSPGAKFQFYIPYELGYGLRGAPPTIPGGSLLIFDVELLEVKKATAQ